MLSDEPYLQFVCTNNVADQQIVGSVIAFVCSNLRVLVRLFQDQLVRFEQSRKLDWYFLPMNRRPFDACMLSDIMRHADRYAAESLNSLGNLVDDLVLLLVMCVEQQMQLIESVSRYLPVMLFVHLSEHDAI